MNTNTRAQGFTLVEVVVALAVVVVAFMAMYGSLQQMVLAATSMQEKTFASWVAYDQITELRINGDFPDGGDKREGEVEMAGSVWLYSIEFNKNTDFDDLLQVIVQVKPEYAPNNVAGIATGALIRATGTTRGGGGGGSGGSRGQPQATKQVGSDSGGALILSGPTDGSAVEGPPPGSGDPPVGDNQDGVFE
jgi:general secretion pathway protein I